MLTAAELRTELDTVRRERGHRRRWTPASRAEDHPPTAWCDMSHYVDFDPREECGIKERVRFDVLQELLEPVSAARS